MDQQMQLLFVKIKEEMDKQTTILTDSITKSVLKEMDKKLKPIIEENLYLKNEVHSLNEKVKRLELGKKENNLVFYGFNEPTEHMNLEELVSNTLNNSGIHINKTDINKAYRIGKAKDKARPVLVNILNGWKRAEILRSKKKLPKNIYVQEDFSLEVLQKRKELVPQLQEERRKGRIAFIKYDKLVVKGETGNMGDKRKREQSTSPKTTNKTTEDRPKINKISAYERMCKSRAHPASSIHKA